MDTAEEVDHNTVQVDRGELLPDLEVGERNIQFQADVEDTVQRECQRHEEEIDETELDCCARFSVRHDCFFRCLKRRPGLFAVLLGVILPLFSLIVVSMFMGFFLSKLEGPNEIQDNDQRMAARVSQEIYEDLVTNLTRIIPWACFELYIGNNRARSGQDIVLYLKNFTLELDLVLLGLDDAKGWGSSEVIQVNSTEMYEFMKECGSKAAPVVKSVVKSLQNITVNASDLTFNWIRCSPDTLGSQFQGNPVTTFNADIRHSAQAEFYSQVWNDRRSAVYHSLTPSGGFKTLDDRVEAEWKSIEQASGEYGCVTNIPASAWFWFTVMTTIGYGNQAPSTAGGRTMVYTFGFCSILGFAAILARAGRIVNATIDQYFVGKRVSCLASPLISCLLWGFIYYSWMLLIAEQIQRWKIERLGDSFSFRDAYWFSYVSTTTIGLGDIFLEPEVLTTQDLLVFPTLFLIGFTYLSAFLGKLRDVVISVTMKCCKKSLVDVLLELVQNPKDPDAS